MTNWDTDWSWLAGILEGEGTISLTKCHTIHERWVIRINNTDESMIKEVKRIAKVGHVNGPRQPKNPKHQPIWVWSTAAIVDALLFLEEILPYMRTERKIAKVQMAIKDLERKIG